MRYARPLIAGSAAVLVAILVATTAFAATTWTIKPGGAVSSTATNVSFKDTTTGSIFTCTSVTVKAMLRSGSGLPGFGAGSISAVTFGNCTGPLAAVPPRTAVILPLTAVALPWRLSLDSYRSGVAAGHIGHMKIRMSGPPCKTVIDGTGQTATDGTLKFSYSDSTGQLTTLTGGDLHFYDVRGCAGLFNDNDPLTISGAFPLSPKQQITSP
jgi:hypothetical protein